MPRFKIGTEVTGTLTVTLEAEDEQAALERFGEMDHSDRTTLCLHCSGYVTQDNDSAAEDDDELPFTLELADVDLDLDEPTVIPVTSV